MYNQKPLLGTLINWAHPLSKGLVGAWIMNEGSGNKIFDLSGNGNHGAFGAGAAAPTWKPGRTGSALDFDGTGDYVNCGTNASLDTIGAITIETWAKVNDWDSGTHRTIISKRAAAGANSYFFYIRNTNKLRFLSDNLPNFAEYDVSGFNDNLWYHLAITFDGNDIILFVNGNPVKTQPSAGTLSSGVTFPVCIGARCAQDLFFGGAIDGIKIYNRALNTNEISQLYYNPYCMFAQPMEAELMYAPPPVGVVSPYYYETLMAGAVV